MSTDNRWSGEIRIVPPLAWDEIKDSDYLPQRHQTDLWRTTRPPRGRRRDVKLRIVEVPVDGGFTRQADAIVPLSIGTYDGREVLTNVADIAATYGEGHTFEGRIECVDDPGYGPGASRIEVQDGRACQVYARLMWPEDYPPAPRHQASTDPAYTAHLRAGERITLPELATEISAAAAWLRQIAIAAETPDIPVELGEMCESLDQTATDLAAKATYLADVDRIITDRVPLNPFFGGREPWGLRAHGSDREQFGKRLSTVLTHWQIRHLAQKDMPWRDDEPGIPYLDGIEGLPGLEAWESTRAERRRAAEREAAIRGLTRLTVCPTCEAGSRQDCRTKTGRLAEQFHRPRIAAATTEYDASNRPAATDAPATADQSAPH